MTYAQPRVGKLLSAIGTANLAIANTETLVVELVFPAGYLAVGMQFGFECWVTRVGATSAAPIIRIRAGAAPVLTANIGTALTVPANTLAVDSKIEGTFSVRTIGAGGTGLAAVMNGIHLAAVTIQPSLKNEINTVSLNTTIEQRAGLTFISGNAGNTYTFRHSTAYRLN